MPGYLRVFWHGFEIARIQQVGEHFELHYLETEDSRTARERGFEGLWGFPLHQEVYREGVKESLLRRVCSRKREDFKKYLEAHGLPEDWDGSDMELVGLTGGRLPSDAFSFALSGVGKSST